MTELAVDERTASPATTDPGRDRAARASSIEGTRHLVWLVLRRDRLRIVLWFVGVVLLMVLSAASIVSLYETPEQLASYGRMVRGNTALIIQAGPGYGLDDPTLGAIMMNETSLWMYVTVSIMSLFMVVRHTRTEEEVERGELVRALPVGRHAPLAAALIGVAIANVMIAMGNVLGLVAYGIPAVGSIAFGASLFAIGMVFGGVGAVAAQVASGSRAALAIGGSAVGLAFVLRAIGDVGNGVLSWCSPLGWAQRIRAFDDERWWVLALPAVTTAALVAVARALQDHRDYGSGLIAQRPGRAGAGPHLASPLGLAVRMQRGTVIGWTVGLGSLSFFYGIVADQAEAILEDNPELADYFVQLGIGSVTDAFMSTAILIMALFATGFTVSSVLRLRSEELAGRADPLLATPMSRRRWGWSHLLVALVGTVVLMSAIGLSMGVGAAIALSDGSQVLRLVAAGLVMAPAMWVVAGAVFLVHTLRPHWSLASWAFVAWVFVAGTFGAVIDLPQWALDLSPFQHVPALPAAAMSWWPLIALVVVAAALLAAGFAALDRRDIG